MESKFISDQTIGYLKSRQGVDHTTQIAELQNQNAEIVKFLQDYQAYYDGELTEGAKIITDLGNRVQQMADTLQNTEERIAILAGHAEGQIRAMVNLKQRLTRIVFVTLGTSCLALGVALFLCLTT